LQQMLKKRNRFKSAFIELEVIIMVYDLGRVCVKIAGRDSGKHCVIIEVIDDRFVTIDGNTRRRKCNVLHLLPLDKTVDVKKKATTGEVKELLSGLGFKVTPVTKPKKKAAKRPVKLRGKNKKSSDKKEN
jgi:large subunit ribosomal protein L14e